MKFKVTLDKVDMEVEGDPAALLAALLDMEAGAGDGPEAGTPPCDGHPIPKCMPGGVGKAEDVTGGPAVVMILRLDPLDLAAVREAITTRHGLAALPEGGGNLEGRILAEICRGRVGTLSGRRVSPDGKHVDHGCRKVP